MTHLLHLARNAGYLDGLHTLPHDKPKLISENRMATLFGSEIAATASGANPNLPDASECVRALQKVDEIKRLSELMGSIEAIESRYLDDTLGAMVIPPPEVREHLMRYETHLSRQLARTLERLELLQRCRLGLPSPPTIKVSRA